jgi:hypothetical protein
VLDSTANVVGFRVLGRHGELGVVVEPNDVPDASSALVVRGGVSSALLYVVPARRIEAVRPDRRTIVLDVDFHDFVPSLRADGIVELRLSGD